MSDKRKKTNEKRGGFELGAQARQYQPRVFRANIGENAEDAGNTLRKCAISAKFGKQSHLHIVGDSAPWTAEQMDDKSARKPPISFRLQRRIKEEFTYWLNGEVENAHRYLTQKRLCGGGMVDDG